MCEGISGLRENRGDREIKSENDRYVNVDRKGMTGHVRFLNLGDLKKLSNKAMKSIAYNLFPSLEDLSIWGCYHITNEGFLELCTSYRSDSFRRVNYCGCYKISDDSRLWISSTFSRVNIYNKPDEFGRDLDTNQTDVYAP